MTEFKHLRPDKPCSHSGTLDDTNGKCPACGDPTCTEPDHWFVATPGSKRTVQSWFKRQLVLLLATGGQQGLPQVATVAHVARTSPQFVRATLKEHGLTLPERQVGKDGKNYSTTRKGARLRALRQALEKADSYLPPEARHLGQTLLTVCSEVEQ